MYGYSHAVARYFIADRLVVLLSPKVETDDRTELIPEKQLAGGGTSTLSSATFNVINSITGSGIIDYSIILLIKAGNLSGTTTYQALVNRAFGLIGYLMLSTLQFLYPFTAFVCHHNSFLIYGSLEKPTISNWSRVTHVSVLLAVFISLLFAGCGYSTFTGYTQGDIFENYCKNDDLATFGRLCYGISIILTFPIECFVTREVVSNVFSNGTLTAGFHIAVTVAVIAVSTAVSLIFDCLGIVLELNGVVSATPLVFIIPTACYLKLSDEHWYHGDNLISCLILFAGVSVMTVGFVMAVLNPQECSHGKEMFYCMSSNSSFNNITFPTNVTLALNASIF
ncbi:Vacuolar amino acid transporter 2 [Acipenser ruthenus]|uniref:Putative sodium-coupled neutral amino acid transporter 11 n=1 Tax=Acipenser ruthenus TaxID=7906 RepID=A0A444U1E8_ACIRT|nr:Vacuolar amino acid transporter 2 [Acipenser ruthenus]